MTGLYKIWLQHYLFVCQIDAFLNLISNFSWCVEKFGVVFLYCKRKLCNVLLIWVYICMGRGAQVHIFHLQFYFIFVIFDDIPNNLFVIWQTRSCFIFSLVVHMILNIHYNLTLIKYTNQVYIKCNFNSLKK